MGFIQFEAFRIHKTLNEPIWDFFFRQKAKKTKTNIIPKLYFGFILMF